MALLKIDGAPIDIDIREELEQYDWQRPKWSDTKLIAASPFRHDKAPSFFVDLESGGWSDSGAYDIEWERGNLPKLLAFLRNETYEETCEYLIDTYGIKREITGRITLPSMSLRKEKRRINIGNAILNHYKGTSTYLPNRGISQQVLDRFSVGYSPSQKAVSLPWFHADGMLANMKFRKTYGKTFWYYPNGAPIRTLVYGIDQVYKHNIREVIVCEAEIDALSWWTAGRPAIAVGSASVNEVQLELIRKSPIEVIVVAMDNDKPGAKLGRRLYEGLRGHAKIDYVRIPSDYKDANEAHVAGVDLAELPQKPLPLIKVREHTKR